MAKNQPNWPNTAYLERLPAWFTNHDLRDTVVPVQTKLLPPDLGLTIVPIEGFALNSSTPERAILELLYLAPQRFDLVEAFQILEGLRTLRPKLMQSLLEDCNSIKVARLFLYMAERAQLRRSELFDPLTRWSCLNCAMSSLVFTSVSLTPLAAILKQVINSQEDLGPSQVLIP